MSILVPYIKIVFSGSQLDFVTVKHVISCTLPWRVQYYSYIGGVPHVQEVNRINHKGNVIFL